MTRAVRDANSEVGARVLELAGREYVLRGRGYVGRSPTSSERRGGRRGRHADPGARRRDRALRPEIRRGAADWNGRGEAVGGIVVMRIGSNALEVIDAVKEKIATSRCPRA